MFASAGRWDAICVCVTFFGSDQIEITREKGAKETREPVDDSQYIRASLSMTAAAVRARAITRYVLERSDGELLLCCV